MPARRVWSASPIFLASMFAVAAVATAGGCGSGESAGGSGGRSGSGGRANGTGGTGSGGTVGSGGAPGSGGALGSGGSGTGGAANGSGGRTGTAGAMGTGGLPGSGGAAGGSGPGTGGGGGQAGQAGQSGQGGRGSGGSGAGGSTTPRGGASARAVCPSGATFGNPLTGMGAVMQIGAPTQGPATFFSFIEGPVWIASLNTVFFSDNASQPAERIFKVVSPMTTSQLFMEMSGSNGLAIDNEDNLVLADQRGRRIVRVNPMTAQVIGTIAPAGNYKPNDLIVRSDNNVYFTDPDTGFYRVSPNGMVSQAMKQVNRPNGIVLSLDENTLYVGDVGNRQIHRFTVAADGTVDTATGSVFVTAMGQTVDGMAVDCAGNLYAGTASGVEVFSPMGMRIGTVPTGEASNCTFGGPERKTLYVTSRSVLKYVQLAVPGLPN